MSFLLLEETEDKHAVYKVDSYIDNTTKYYKRVSIAQYLGDITDKNLEIEDLQDKIVQLKKIIKFIMVCI